jgi:hypothetical protein
VIRHWYLDWDGPRPETDVLAAAETIQHEQEAVERRTAARIEIASATDVNGVAAQHGAASQADEPDPG